MQDPGVPHPSNFQRHCLCYFKFVSTMRTSNVLFLNKKKIKAVILKSIIPFAWWNCSTDKNHENQAL